MNLLVKIELIVSLTLKIISEHAYNTKYANNTQTFQK